MSPPLVSHKCSCLCVSWLRHKFTGRHNTRAGTDSPGSTTRELARIHRVARHASSWIHRVAQHASWRTSTSQLQAHASAASPTESLSPGGSTEPLILQSPDHMPPPPRSLPWGTSKVYPGPPSTPDSPACLSLCPRMSLGNPGRSGPEVKFLTLPWSFWSFVSGWVGIFADSKG